MAVLPWVLRELKSRGVGLIHFYKYKCTTYIASRQQIDLESVIFGLEI